MTTQKLAICPYCGESLSKKPKSIDHIIPKQIGGSNRFTIVSCQSCNSEMSKIEQSAMNTIGFSSLLAEIGESGFNIKTRRKRDYIPLQKSVGLSCCAPIKMYYNNKKHQRELVFLSPPKKELIEGGTFNMIVPAFATEDSEKDRISQVALANKIVLGTCVWLWGDDFSMTRQASDLRNRMKAVKIQEILEMDSSDKHLELPEHHGDDALDNRPHHSVLIGRMENKNMKDKVVGLINIFGSFESLTVIGDYDNKFRNWIGDSGIVIISKTTQNQVLKMTWEEYEKFKSAHRIL